MKRILLFLLMAIAANAFAQPTIHYVNLNVPASGDGTSWDEAFKTLQEALDVTEAPSEIWVANGTYYPTSTYGLGDDPRLRHFRMKNGVGIYGGFEGIETHRDQRNLSPIETILSGKIDTLNVYHVFLHYGLGLDQTAILDGFRIEDGKALHSEDLIHGLGGGMLNIAEFSIDGDPNDPSNYIPVDGTGSSPTIRNCIFWNNEAYIMGGAIANFFKSSPSIISCNFGFNSAMYGGGAIANVALAETKIRNSFFMFNNAQEGGAILNQEGSAILISNCHFGNNTAEMHGGAIRNDDDTNPRIINTYFVGNSASLGGAVQNNTGSTPLFVNCVFKGNWAAGENEYLGGGGMNNYHCDPIIINCTFNSNSTCTFSSGGGSGRGAGGITNNESNPNIINTIMYGNYMYPYEDSIITIDNYLSEPIISHSSIQQSNGSGIEWNDDFGIDGGSNIDENPEFDSLNSNQLTAGSPCVDTGTNAPFEEGGVAYGIVTDYRGSGFPRIMDGDQLGGIVDMGAYEFNSDTLKVTVTSSAGNNGSITPLGAIEVLYGGILEFIIQADSSYAIDSLMLDSLYIGVASAKTSFTYLLEGIADDLTVDVSFAAYNTINATAGQGGSIAPSGDVNVLVGRDKEFTITASSGYQIDELLVDNEPVTGAEGETVYSYTFEAVDTTHTISASFIALHTITATAGEGGSITPDGAVTLLHGQSQAFTITADSSYLIATLLVDGDSIADVEGEVEYTYTFSEVAANHTIAVNFIVQHTITASAGEGGSITPDGAVTLLHGQSQAFTITADSSYLIATLLVDGDTVADAVADAEYTYTFSGVAASHTISATFIESHIITATAGEGGSISPEGAVPVAQGQSQAFTITADSSYLIATLLVDGDAAGDAVGEVEYTYTFSGVSVSHTITATFIESHIITATAGEGGSISPEGGVLVLQGQSQSFTITADSSYLIATLLVDDNAMEEAVGEDEYTYAFSGVTASHTITATFIALHTITATADEGGSISPEGAVPVTHGQSQAFTITADSGYLIATLLVDGDAVAEAVGEDEYIYTFSALSASHTIEAAFTIEQDPGLDPSPSPDPEPTSISDLLVGEVTIFPNPAKSYFSIKLEGLPESQRLAYQITDIVGRVLEQQPITSPTTLVSVEGMPSAIYFVTILKNDRVVSTVRLSVQ